MRPGYTTVALLAACTYSILLTVRYYQVLSTPRLLLPNHAGLRARHSATADGQSHAITAQPHSLRFWSTCPRKDRIKWRANVQDIVPGLFSNEFEAWGWKEILAAPQSPLDREADWLFYFPCAISKVFDEVALIDVRRPNQQVIMSIPGRTPFASKKGLFRGLVEYYGRDGATQLLPPSWNLDVPEDVDHLRSFFRSNPNFSTLLLKSVGGHRQRGLRLLSSEGEVNRYLTHELPQVNKGKKPLAQILLDNAIRVDGLSVAGRAFVHVFCDPVEGHSFILVDTDAPAYFSERGAEEGGMTLKGVVASGYSGAAADHTATGRASDTTSLFRSLEGDTNHGVSVGGMLRESLLESLRRVFVAFRDVACAPPAGSQSLPRYYVVIFGVDYIPIVDGTVRILEVNRFPDLAPIRCDERKPLLCAASREKNRLKFCTLAASMVEAAEGLGLKLPLEAGCGAHNKSAERKHLFRLNL